MNWPKCFIYGLIDPWTGELRYVGQTSTGEYRLRTHWSPAFQRSKSHLHHWLRKLKRLGRKFEVVLLEEVARPEDLDDAEIFHIAYFRALGCRLTNADDGGQFTRRGRKMSPEHRLKLSLAQKGKPKKHKRSAESYAIQAAKALGRKRSLEAIAKTAAAKRGTKHTRDALARMATAHRKLWSRPGHAEKMSRAHGCLPFIDQRGNRYETVNGAARALNIPASCISRVLNGERASTKGFTFKFLEAA